MKSPQITSRKWNYPALAFLMTCGGLLLLRLISALTFNGTYSLLYSDNYHQYYPFFVAFRKALLSGDSLLYNWNAGMGMDYLGLISYYLASPLNLLSVLIPESWTLAYFSLLMPVKLGLAALFFALFLKKTFRKNGFSVAVFGCFYGLCAWALGYQWNIMWLDTFALLPLVAMGTIALLNEKKFILYTLTLFLSVFSNYYIGFFTCIFVLLLFICYQICRWGGFKKFFTDLIRIAVFSILAIGMTALLELPALAALQNTQSSVNNFPKGFRLNIADKSTWKGLFDAMRQVAGNMNGGLEPTFKEGLPNLYCGISTNIFAILFLTCKQVRLRDKICSVLLLLFLNVSFIIRQLDYIWHGFHFTNMIPYRFSFLYSFILLYMAYQAWTLRRSFRLWQIAVAGVLSIGLMLCSNDITLFGKLLSGQVTLSPWTSWDQIYSNLETIAMHSTYLIYNVVFLGIYLSVLVYAHFRKAVPKECSKEQKRQLLHTWRNRRKLGSSLLLLTMVLELSLNIVNFGAWFPITDVSNYPRGTLDAARAIRYMQEREADTLFYRAETTHSQTLNDGALNGYYGISTFTSSANVKVTEFMKALGYGAKNTYNRYCFEESSPVANLFLNLKYMLERDGKVEQNPYFDDVHYFGNVHLLENNAYLPLGFLANSQILNVDFALRDSRFILQNNLMQAATGISQPVWSLMNRNNLVISGSNLTVTSAQTQTGYCTYSSEGKAGTVTYSYTADRDGLVCTYLDLSKNNSFSVYHNGNLLYSESYSLPQMLSVCNVTAGDVVEIKLNCSANQKGTIIINTAVLDEELFRQGYDMLNASTLELNHFENTYLEGTIQCNRSGVLYTSIPQDGNWIVAVDGKEVESVLVGDAMIAVPITEGYHTVSFTYHNRAFSLGWKISLACLLMFLSLYVIIYQPKIKPVKGKYEK